MELQIKMNHIELKRISLDPDKYGNSLKIRLVTVFKDGKYVKHTKIDEDIVSILLDTKIEITEEKLNDITRTEMETM